MMILKLQYDQFWERLPAESNRYILVFYMHYYLKKIENSHFLTSKE